MIAVPGSDGPVVRPPTPTWVKVFGLALVVLVAALLITRLAGVPHGPGMHDAMPTHGPGLHSPGGSGAASRAYAA